jgi:DNA polymerase V
MGKDKDDNLYLQRIDQLKKFHYEEDRLPSVIEMRTLFHVSSQSAVQAFMLRMITDGLVRKDGKNFLPTDELVGIPSYDDARGGVGTDVKDVEKHQIVLAKFLVDNPLTTRFAKVAGDSMEEAGIMEGDFVIVDTAKRARIGDIIFVIDYGKSDRLVKYYEKDDNGKPVLRSANPEYKDIPVTRDMEIAGVVTGSFRRF